jgi:hypothetical protein
MTWLQLSPGLRMALMRSTTAASTWMKHWPRSRCMGPRADLEQRRGDGVIDGLSKGDANHLRALDPNERKFHGATQSPREPPAYKLSANVNEALGLMGDGVAVPAIQFLAENLLEPLLLTFAL